MAFDRLRLRYAAITGVFSLTVLGCAFAAVEKGYVFTTALLGAVAVGEAVLLYRLAAGHSRSMERFLASVRWGDLTAEFPAAERDRALGGLETSLGEALTLLRSDRTDREEGHLFLREILEHAGVGIVAYRRDGAVALANTTAKRLLGTPRIETTGDIVLIHPNLGNFLAHPEPGKRAVITIGEGIETVDLALHAAEAVVHGERIVILSFRDIRGELETREAEAWQNLIRVLTHEIMNSVTPISSLASTARNLLEDRGGSEGIADGETIEDVRGAVRAIEERSRGLIRFVESYRTLTRIPTPRLAMIQAGDLFDRVRRLMGEQLDAAGIRFTVRVVPEALEIAADPELMEQALINLIQNSIQALKGRPEGIVRLEAGLDELARPFLSVSDNGPGMEPEVMEKAFIPFFTTRREGTGIGLSLAQRIVRLHGGTIIARSKPGAETVFTVRLPG